MVAAHDVIVDREEDGASESDVSSGSKPVSGIPPFYRDIQAFEFLFEDYAPDCWYWELVETGRRLLLTAVLTVISEDSAVQARK